MRDVFRNYDAWLEAPFQRMCAEAEAEQEARERLAEEQGLEMEGPEMEAAWAAFLAEEEQRATDAAEAAAEAWYDRRDEEL